MRLKDLYPSLSGEQRKALADTVGVTPRYLWQIATGWRPGATGERLSPPKRASIALVAKVAAADARLHVADLVSEFAEAAKEAA